MEIEETFVKKNNQFGDLKIHQDRFGKLTREIEKLVEELQQQLLFFERQILEKKLLPPVKRVSSFAPAYMMDYKKSELDRKKIELEKLTFTHGAYRDKKAILSFSLGQPEVNIHNLNYRMTHEARSMREERHLLSMMDPNKHSNFGFSLQELDQQIQRLDYDLQWRNASIGDRDKFTKNRKELIMERDQLFVNSPIKGFIWSSLPSSIDLRNQIQVLEKVKEEDRKVFMERRKMIESNKREAKKADNEMKSLRKTIAIIRNKKQKALQTLSQYNELFKNNPQGHF